MKRIIALVLFTCMLVTVAAALADYSKGDAWNVAEHVVRAHLEEIGATKPRFPMLDYHMCKDGNRYAMYSDVKYMDKNFKDQRAYFVVMFDETDDGIELYMMTFGTEVYLLDGYEK